MQCIFLFLCNLARSILSLKIYLSTYFGLTGVNGFFAPLQQTFQGAQK